MDWLTHNWVTLVASLWAFEKLLEVVATLTPWKWDDNLGVILGNILKRFFPKG